MAASVHMRGSIWSRSQFPSAPPLPARTYGGRWRRPTRAGGVRAAAAVPPDQGRRPQNAGGEFFVDERCIDCDVCRWMAPKTFARVAGQSAVVQQPGCEEERLRALQALLSCPTVSIHTEKPPKDIREVHKTFPLPVDEQSIPGVYHCGFHSVRTYGATSYLIVHPDGNILVDSPKYKEVLARNIEALGGISYMFLTHKDDIGDHKLWAERFGCKRIFHSADVGPSTADVEMQLYGEGPWSINDDFELVYTPGHTKGSVCLLYKPLKALFSGDTLAKSQESGFSIFEQYNQQSVKMQLRSVEKFLHLDFLWILPGHGRRVMFRDVEEKNAALEAFLAGKMLEDVSAVVSARTWWTK